MILFCRSQSRNKEPDVPRSGTQSVSQSDRVEVSYVVEDSRLSVPLAAATCQARASVTTCTAASHHTAHPLEHINPPLTSSTPWRSSYGDRLRWSTPSNKHRKSHRSPSEASKYKLHRLSIPSRSLPRPSERSQEKRMSFSTRSDNLRGGITRLQLLSTPWRKAVSLKGFSTAVSIHPPHSPACILRMLTPDQQAHYSAAPSSP